MSPSLAPEQPEDRELTLSADHPPQSLSLQSRCSPGIRQPSPLYFRPAPATRSGNPWAVLRLHRSRAVQGGTISAGPEATNAPPGCGLAAALGQADLVA